MCSPTTSDPSPRSTMKASNKQTNYIITTPHPAIIKSWSLGGKPVLSYLATQRKEKRHLTIVPPLWIFSAEPVIPAGKASQHSLGLKVYIPSAWKSGRRERSRRSADRQKHRRRCFSQTRVFPGASGG
ncbi:hypothetical protein CEXT_184701 [Caerostris extrusa]|uniref:Uncharacterized protein n=1 Tax=Caerostris extrusa TaxID=172846 RepID=A0AAV4P3S6_CAEEX|nr:hypothetical protein CEXT_184701 [Caerostris extrusa]